MKQTVYLYDFDRAFEVADRLDNFSYEGRSALYDYLIGYEESVGEEFELDVIALCCEFSEFENLKDFQDQYDDSYRSLEDIEERTLVIRIPDSEGFLIQNF